MRQLINPYMALVSLCILYNFSGDTSKTSRVPTHPKLTALWNDACDCSCMDPGRSWPSLALNYFWWHDWSCEMVSCWPFEVHRVIGCISWRNRISQCEPKCFGNMATFTPFVVGICWYLLIVSTLAMTPTSSGQCRVEVDFGGNPWASASRGRLFCFRWGKRPGKCVFKQMLVLCPN